MSAEWTPATLETVAHIEMGQSPPSEFVSETEGDGLPFLQGNAEFTDLHPQARLWCRKPAKRAARNDTLISVRAPVGALNLADREYCIGRGLSAIRFFGVDPSFGFHATALRARALRRVAQGTTFEAIGRADLRRLEFPVPTPNAQRRIAEILDTLDEAIRGTEQVIAKLQQMKQGLLHDLLTRGIDENGELRDPARHPEHFKATPLGRLPDGWAVPSLGEIVEHVGSGVTPFGGSSTYLSSGVPFIRSQNVHFDGLHLDDVAFISSVVHHAMARSAILPNDVLLNITGASIGRCCPVPPGFPEANVNQHVCAIRVADATQEDAEYLAAFLGSHAGQHQVDILNAGSNRQGLNYRQVRAFVIAWPAEPERVRITQVLSAFARRIQHEAVGLEKLRALRRGLSHDLLTGRVRVPIPEDATP